jgi:hypothetical protein
LAVKYARAEDIEPVDVKVPPVGSYSSAVAIALVPVESLIPPTSSALPVGSNKVLNMLRGEFIGAGTATKLRVDGL